MKHRPLEGVRIVTVEQVLQLPWGTMVLADMGADVIRVESLSRLDSRRWRPFPDNRTGPRWWNQSGHYTYFYRNKRSLTLDLKHPRGKEVLQALARVSDVVCENNRPGAMERLGLGYDVLSRQNPTLIMLRSSGFGQSGPWRQAGAYGRTIQPLSGMYATMGYQGGPPMRFEDSFIDIVTGWNNALAILMALHRRRRTGQGAYIDISMYETGVRLLGPALLGMQMGRPAPRRMGNDHPQWAPHGCYRCRGEDEWVAIAVTSDEEWRALTRALGSPPWARSRRLATAAGRRARRQEVDERIQEWTRTQDKHEVMHLLQRAGVAAGAVLRAPDLLADPHLKAREFFQRVAYPPEWERVGRRPLPGRPYHFSKTPGASGRAATLGEHNGWVLRDLLGLPEGDIRRLEGEGVIGCVPPDEELMRPEPAPMEKLIARGELSGWDPDYKQRLGLEEGT